MIGRRRQHGATGALIVTIFVFVLVGILAAYLLSRIASSSASNAETTARLALAADALDQFAASAHRLPCPADPALDDGSELPAVPTGACSFPGGTVPWKTIGMKREDALDSWGRKLSYRVYTGAAGSLTQANGASMVDCDTVEATPGGVAPGGLCRPELRVTFRNTTPAQFFAGKGLSVDDGPTPLGDVAFVLVSHGVTGLGGYTVSGVRLDLPAGDERDNTRDSGPFHIHAFSDVDTEATKNSHFDDLLAYRRIGDLAQRAGLAARDWPEDVTTRLLFDQAAVEAAVGQPVTPGDSVGQVTVNFIGAVATGAGSGSLADISFAIAGGQGGIGVASGGSAMIQSTFNEGLRFDLERGTNFAFTLNDFGISSGFIEIVELRFYLGGSQIDAPVYRVGCNGDGGLASYSVPVGTPFDRVDITAFPSVRPSPFALGLTAFLVSEIKSCAATEATCTTSLAQPSNSCA